MKRSQQLFLTACLFFSIGGISQTKAELQIQLDKKIKSLDSLKAIADNQENIIENRDRSIMILKEDIAKLNEEKETLNMKIRQKNTELVQLRNNNKSGEAKRITINNTRPLWSVPEGKTWVINQFMGDYITDLVQDSTGNFVGKEIHVFIQALNGTVLTDLATKQLGPQVYSSIASNHTIRFPLILTEKTSFSLLVCKGPLHALELFDGNVVCTYYEKAN